MQEVRGSSPRATIRDPFTKATRTALGTLGRIDEGIFESDISNECTIAINQSDITHAELKAMSFNSLATSFAAPDLRSSVTRQLETDFALFEAVWKDLALGDASTPSVLPLCRSGGGQHGERAH